MVHILYAHAQPLAQDMSATDAALEKEVSSLRNEVIHMSVSLQYERKRTVIHKSMSLEYKPLHPEPYDPTPQRGGGAERWRRRYRLCATRWRG